MSSKAEAAVSYAALILADENIDITADQLQILLQAAGIEDVEPIWTTLFANALKGKDVKEILTATCTVAVPVNTLSKTDKPLHIKDNDGEQRDDANKPLEDGDESDEDFGASLFDL